MTVRDGRSSEFEAIRETIALKFSLSAEDAFDRGMGAWGVQKNPHGNGITLQNSTLVEDDGSGIGSDCEWLKVGRGPVLELSGELCAKKLLHVDRPQASSARLYVPEGTDVTVNKRLLDNPVRKCYREFPTSLLKQGDNEILLTRSGSGKSTIKIAPRKDILEGDPARKDRPPRSFKSEDGGKTFQTIDGELMVRLHLTQYAESGCFISPVVDSATSSGCVLADSRVSLLKLSLSHHSETPPGTHIEFFARTGSTPSYDAAYWSEWEELPLSDRGEARYFQWKAVLSSCNPLATPVLNELTADATVTRTHIASWTAQVRVRDSHNETIRYSSVPFEYENPFHPRLVALRQRYKLDDVIRDGKTEFEKMIRLRDWVSRQWKWTPPENYPPFDADKIIQAQLGFCVHFAVVFIQCAASLGYQARFVFGQHPEAIDGGHEVTEYWSNEYGKWIMLDPADNLHQIDRRTREPLGMLEIHERMLRACYNRRPESNEYTVSGPRLSDEMVTCKALELAPIEETIPAGDPRKAWPPWAMWMYVRYIPRNNFFDKPETLPRFQGWNWDWTGYWFWLDEQTKPEWRYRNFTGRRQDLDWSINQVCFDATCGKEPGTIHIQMATVTPNFQAFLTAIDGNKWETQPHAFCWKLKPGKNRLEMQIRNTAGVPGPISYLEVLYRPG